VDNVHKNNNILLKPWERWSTLRSGRCRTNVHWTFCTSNSHPLLKKRGKTFMENFVFLIVNGFLYNKYRI